MTFDEFKKHFDPFNKLDTPEKLAICENQYQRYLLRIEGQNYFEPSEDDLVDNVITQYRRNLDHIFAIDDIKENHFYFLVKPSFEPECLLVIEKIPGKYLLSLKILAQNYWSVFYSNNKTVNIDMKRTAAELNNTIGDKLFKLLDKAFIEARKPEAGWLTLDGVVYELLRRAGNKIEALSKHSPSADSKSGKIINILVQIIDNISILNDDILLNIETEMDNVL